jgi:hypothetical protein
MRNLIIFLFLNACLFAGNHSLFAQNRALPIIEKELQEMAFDILNHDSLDHKISLNKKFASLLIETLKRKDSYTYPFDSLKTISILQPADKSFRIFSWYIVDKNYREMYGQQYHYYFGLVQREYVDPKTQKTEYIVIPLLELPKLPQGVENMQLDNNNWLGALYYAPRNHDYLPALESKAYGIELQAGGKRKKVKQTLYLLMGWNGYDNRSDFKVVDVMYFDPKDKTRVLFGADIFYFDILPKQRAFFRYSEYASFSMNFGYVKTGPFKIFRKEMIVFDHLAPPESARKMEEVLELGPDGSYDGLRYYKRRDYFEWYRNISPASKFNRRLSQKRQEEIRKEQEKKMREAGIRLEGME